MITPAGMDPESDAFWVDVKSGGLPLRRCTRCARAFVLPLPSCPYCAMEHPEIIQARGTGRLYSWVVVRHAFDRTFAAEVPYVVAAVTLDEGARVYARLEGIELADLVPDLPVVRVAPVGGDGPSLVFHPLGTGPT